ncbi:MAG: hypothetical protein RBT74_08430 [Tenuifilaceae bacterium]|nr:hypothetical protein [Tenuifilaceae bacterium]
MTDSLPRFFLSGIPSLATLNFPFYLSEIHRANLKVDRRSDEGGSWKR